MSSTNVKNSEMSSAKGDQERTSIVQSDDEVLVTPQDDMDGRSDGKPSEEQMKTSESDPNNSPIQPVGAGRPQNQKNMQRRQQNQKTYFSELQKGPVKKEQRENTGSSKQRNNQQKAGNQGNLSRGSSQNSLTGKMNNMAILDPRRPDQQGFQRINNSAGHINPNHQNRSQNKGKNQYHWQEQPQVVSQFNFQTINNRSIRPPQNQPGFAPYGHCYNKLYQKNPGSSTQLVQIQAFPPLSFPGNEFCGPQRSAPNSPGPMNPPGQYPMHPELSFTRSSTFPYHENVKNEFPYHASNEIRIDYGQCPPLHTNGQRLNNAGFVSPLNSNGARSNFQDGRNTEPGGQQYISGKKFQNGAGNQSLDGHNQKKQENKTWKNNNNQSASPVKFNRQSYPATTTAVTQGGPMIPNNKVMGPMHGTGQQQYFNNQEVFVSQPDFGPVPNSVYPPMLSPVTTASFQQYVDEQRYTVAFYQGGNYVPYQQWAPMTEEQGNFVPYTMGPRIPHSTVPYPVTNNQSIVPYAAVPYPTGISSHGFASAVPPTGPENMSAQVLSFTVSSRVGPVTASAEVPKHDFNLSQLERGWEENPTQHQFEANSQTQCREIVSSPEDGQRRNEHTVEDQHQRKGAEWLPEKQKKMLDVSSLEKLQRMSSTNGKRAPMNARNKDSPNHMPTATPPDVQEEVIKFICDSWNKVYQEYQKGSPTVAFHVDADPCTIPEGFVPFDLEAYWGKRLVQNMTTQNIPTQNM